MKKSIAVIKLQGHGIEVLQRVRPRHTNIPEGAALEPPCSLKWTRFDHSLELGAFSYMVSGYAFAARIGRYCSIAESVQIGRQDHSMKGVSVIPPKISGVQK